MSHNLLYLWETFCFSWKFWLGLSSFLLGLWFAWLKWSPLMRQFRRACVDQRDLELSVKMLKRRVDDHLAGAAVVSLPHKRFKGDSGLEAAALMRANAPQPDESESDLPQEHGQLRSRLGFVYDSPPEERDDLTSLGGINEVLQDKLHGVGIYQFNQIANLSDDQIATLKQTDPVFEEVHWGFWRERLRARLRREASKSEASIIPVPMVEAQASAPPAEELADPQLPIELRAESLEESVNDTNDVSNHIDQKTPRLPVRKPVVQPSHEASGKPKAVASLQDEVSRESEANSPSPVPAPVLPAHFAGEAMTLSSKFGWVYSKKPAGADDLSLIEGLKPPGVTLLGNLGIHKFKQIAHLKDEEVAGLVAHAPALGSIDWLSWRARFLESPKLPELPKAFQGEPVSVSLDLGILYDEKPSCPDDLTKLHGIDATLAAALNRKGVYRFEQLAQLSDEQISAWRKQDPSLESFPWEWWRERLRSSGGALEKPASLNEEALQLSPELGWVYPNSPAHVDDFTLIRGVDSADAQKLHDLGIYRYAQLAELDNEQLAHVLARVPDMKALDWGFWQRTLQAGATTLEPPAIFEGEKVQRCPKFGWIYPRQPLDADQLTLLHGVGHSQRESLNRLGIYKFKQIARWSDTEQAALLHEDPALDNVDWAFWRQELQATGGKVEIPETFQGEPVSLAPDRGLVYRSAPANQDRLSLVQGIDPATADALNQHGLYRFAQMAHLSDAQIAAWKKWVPSLHDFPWTTWRARFQTSCGQLDLPEAFRSEPVQVSSEFGVVYPYAPASIDDFAKLEGVGPQALQKLRQLGIYRFAQIAALDDACLARLSESDRCLREVDWNSWRTYFQKSNGMLEMPDAFREADVVRSPRLGLVYRSAPQDADVLAHLQGIDAETASALNQRGFFRCEQFAHLSDSEIAAWESTESSFQRVPWRSWRSYFQRKKVDLEIPYNFAADGVQRSPDFGWIYSQRPDSSDDLTLLQGIGPAQSLMLNRLGIYKFKQIALWTDEDIDNLVARCPDLAAVPWMRWRDRFLLEGAELVVPSAFRNEPVQVSPDYGVVYPSPPAVCDQLELVDGVTDEAERRMHALGIYRFRQIGFLTDAQITALRAESPALKRVAWNLWRAYYHVKGALPSAALARVRRGVPMEFANDNHVYQDPQLGTLYRQAPSEVDQLSLIEGIDSEMEAELYRRGIYTFRQLAYLRDQQFAFLRQENPRFHDFAGVVRRWKRVAGKHEIGGHWRWTSWDSVDGDLQSSHPGWGPIFKERPPHVDNLSLLDGVSGVQAALLKDSGIYQYAQIAQLTESQIEALGEKHPSLKELNAAQLRFQAGRFLGKVVSLRNGH